MVKETAAAVTATALVMAVLYFGAGLSTGAAYGAYSIYSNLSASWSDVQNSPYQFQYTTGNGTFVNMTQDCTSTTGSNYKCWKSGESDQTSMSLYPLTYNISLQSGAGGGVAMPNPSTVRYLTQVGNYTFNVTYWHQGGAFANQHDGGNVTVYLNNTKICDLNMSILTGSQGDLGCVLGSDVASGSYVRAVYGSNKDSFYDWWNITERIYYSPSVLGYDNSTASVNGSLAGSTVRFNLSWSSPNGLSAYVFSLDNGNTTFVNKSPVTFSGIDNWTVYNATLNSTPGLVIRWYVWANDTTGAGNTSAVYSFSTGDEVRWYNITGRAVNTTENSSYALFVVNLSTTLGLNVSHAWFELDNGNGTAINFTEVWAGSPSWVSNFTWNLNESANVSIRWRVYFNATGAFNATPVFSFLTRNLTFTLKIGTGITKFNVTNATFDSYTAANGQDNVTSFFNITSNAEVPIRIQLAVNQTNTNFSVCASAYPVSEGCVPLDTTWKYVLFNYTNVTQRGQVGHVWLYANGTFVTTTTIFTAPNFKVRFNSMEELGD